MNLPKSYEDAMLILLGDEEYQAYLESFRSSRTYGLRVNTGKITVEEFLKITPFHLVAIPWVDNGFFYDESEAVTKHPHYHAGLYYVQEPSAMIPADRLPIEEGDFVLDLCAAPGGKATELGAKLGGTGLLAANDISNSRAKGLLKNLELFGLDNILVTSETPQRLLSYFPEFFDKILIDAPCSGEGMFRKDQAMIKSWLEHGPEYYREIQREILKTAAGMLKPGGKLLYSTCTFSPLEDEGVIQYLLDEMEDMELLPMKEYEGLSSGLPEAIEGGCQELVRCIRVWPHKMQGEGHFAALLGRQQLNDGKIEGNKSAGKGKSMKLPQECKEFLELNLLDKENTWFAGKQVTVYEDKVYAIPQGFGNIRGLRFLRTGLFLGEVKKKRFEPSQAFAMSLRMDQARNTCSFSSRDTRVIKYLKGETVELGEDSDRVKNGWVLMGVDGYSLGWAKATNGTLKNKYYPGWRLQ